MNTNARAWISFIVLGSVWGGSFLFIKVIGRDLTPFTLVAVRLGLASLALWIFALATHVRFPTSWKVIGGLALVGAIKNTIPFIMIAVGQQWIDSGVSSILNSATPLFTLAIAQFALRDERITWYSGIGMLVGFGGIIIISSRSISSLEIADWQALAGHILMIAATIFFALTAIISRRFFRDIDPIVMSVITISAAFFFALVVALIVDRPINLVMQPEAIAALLVLSLAGTALANYLYFYIILVWGATRASLVTYVSPVVGLILGVLVLHEPLDWRLFAGFIMVLSAIAIASLKPGARPPSSSSSREVRATGRS